MSEADEINEWLFGGGRLDDEERLHDGPVPDSNPKMVRQTVRNRDGEIVRASAVRKPVLTGPSVTVEVEVGDAPEERHDPRRRDAAAPRVLKPSPKGQSRLGSVIFGNVDNR